MNLLPFGEAQVRDADLVLDEAGKQWRDARRQFVLHPDALLAAELIRAWPGKGLVAFGSAVDDLFAFCTMLNLVIDERIPAGMVAYKTRSFLTAMHGTPGKNIFDQLEMLRSDELMRPAIACHALTIFRLLGNVDYCRQFVEWFADTPFAAQVCTDFNRWQAERQS
jgi:hypothetical protein